MREKCPTIFFDPSAVKSMLRGQPALPNVRSVVEQGELCIIPAIMDVSSEAPTAVVVSASTEQTYPDSEVQSYLSENVVSYRNALLTAAVLRVLAAAAFALFVVVASPAREVSTGIVWVTPFRHVVALIFVVYATAELLIPFAEAAETRSRLQDFSRRERRPS